jgi:hypothetical protein
MLKYMISDGTSMQTDVLMREGARIRKVEMQGDKVCAWAETPGGADPLTERTFCVIGTGMDVPDPGVYLATVFEGPYVWHVYEVTLIRGWRP